MSDTLKKVIFDCATGETVELPMTEEELAELEAGRIAAEEKAALETAEAARIADLKASARAKLVAGEPLTEEEAATLVI